MTIVLPLQTRRIRRRRSPGARVDAPPLTADRVPRVPRVPRVLALAHHWRGLVRDGVVKDQAALARLVGVSRARVTQVLDLLYLAPDVQEAILFADDRIANTRHRDLLPIAAEPAWVVQRRAWQSAGMTR